MTVFCIVPCYLPSILYRITFKATSLAYAPFVWVAQTTFYSPLSTKVRLERITKGELEKVRRWLSGIVLSAFITKLGFALGWVNFAQLLAEIPNENLINNFVQLHHLPWWQLTLVTEAVITFLLLFFADAALGRLEEKHAWPERMVLDTISSVTFVRSALSILTISGFCYLALVFVFPDWMQHLLTK